MTPADCTAIANEASPGLCLPREEILDRAFVLKPLAELAGDRIHPVEHQTFRQLWEAFAGEARLTPVEI